MVIKYSSNGEVEWAHGIGGIDSEYIRSVAECSDRGYIVGGEFSFNIFVSIMMLIQVIASIF